MIGNEPATLNEVNRMLGNPWYRTLRGLPLRGRRFGRQIAREGYENAKAATFRGFTPRFGFQEGLAGMEAADLNVPHQTAPLGQHADVVGNVYDQRLEWYFSVLDDYYGHSGFWNWGFWDAGTLNQREACENLVEQLLAFIPEKKGRILDAACGLGGTTRYLLKYYEPENVIAINIGAQQLDVARKNAPGCTFLLMDATELEFRNNAIDNIICVEAAFHFDTREAFLHEAYRVLKPGGRLILSDILMPQWAPLQVEENFVSSLEEYKKLFLRAGFEKVNVVDATDACWKGFARYSHRYLTQKLFRGEIDLGAYRWLVGRLLLTDPVVNYYVLAGARKGNGKSSV